MPRKNKADATPAPSGPGGVLLTLQPAVSSESEPDPSPESELTEEQTAEIAAIEDKFQGIPGDTPVEVYRYQEDGDLGFCGKIPAHTFSPSEVARRWHTAGKYRAISRVKDKGGKVVPGGVRNKVFTLDDMAVAEFVTAAPVGTPVAVVPSGMDGAMAAMMTAMTAMMGGMASALKDVLTAKNPVSSDSPLDMMDKVAGIMEKIAKPAGPAQDFAGIVAMMNDVLDLKERTAVEPGPGDDPLMALARENLPRIIGVLENAQRNGNKEAGELATKLRAPARVPALAIIPATPVPAPAPPVPTEAQPMWQLALAARKGHLLAMAQRDKDPQIFADAEFAMMEGTPVAGPFRQFLALNVESQQPGTAPACLADILKAVPEFSAYEEWATVFLVRLQELFQLVPEGTVDALYEDEPPATDGPKLVAEPLEDSIPGANG